MLFKRSQPRSFLHYSRDMLWPTMHWRRIVAYFQHRLFRQSDSTYRVAGGLATGIAVSFTPLLGLHLVQTILYAHIFRQSKIASLIGTLGGNPWTLPFMFYADYKVGVWLMDIFWDGRFASMPTEHTLENFLSNPMGLFLPLMIGAVSCALIAWFVFYAILYYPVREMQKIYNHRRAARAGIRKPAVGKAGVV